MKELKDNIHEKLKPIIKDIRREHVHEKNYSDNEVSRGVFLELLEGEEPFSEWYELSYLEIRREKSKAIKKYKEYGEKILARTCKKIKPVTENIYKNKSEQK